jgi:hypothetical protein
MNRGYRCRIVPRARTLSEENDKAVADADYWQPVREVAASRPPLTGEQRDELAAIIRKSNDKAVADADYWQRVREVAASRPPLTGEQRDELAAIIRKSRVRRETERLLALPAKQNP